MAYGCMQDAFARIFCTLPKGARPKARATIGYLYTRRRVLIISFAQNILTCPGLCSRNPNEKCNLLPYSYMPMSRDHINFAVTPCRSILRPYVMWVGGGERFGTSSQNSSTNVLYIPTGPFHENLGEKLI